MRHVDEDTIHAWLDEQITDPAEAAWIEEHFRECGPCRVRLASERATFDRAQMLLAGTAPSGERPSFEALVAKAGRSASASEATSVAALTRGRRERWFIQAGWAASVAIAVGLGWTARELTERDSPRPESAPRIAEQSVSIPADPAAPAEAPPGFPERLNGVPPGLPERLNGVPRPVAKPGTGADVSTVPGTTAGGRQQTATESRRSDTAPASVQPQAPPPAAAAGPSQADTAARLEAAPRALERSRNAAAAAAETAPVVRQEDLRITGEIASRVAATPDSGWRPVPRTEAAARTGMPLYGLDGLEPLYTALSDDGSQVRTLYRLSSGDQVEVVQQRSGPVEVVQQRRGPVSPPAVADLQNTGRALAETGRVGIVARPVSGTRTWSTDRGGVRVTLQTTSTADLDALGTRLRVD